MPRLARPGRSSAAREDAEQGGGCTTLLRRKKVHQWFSSQTNDLHREAKPHIRKAAVIPLASTTLSLFAAPTVSTTSPKPPDLALEKLPIYEWKEGTRRQFATRDAKMWTVSTDILNPDEISLPAIFQQLPIRFRRKLDDVWSSFFPDPEGVTPEYFEYSKWRFVQRIASSSLSVMATQQMLMAIGLGAKRSLPTAAAVNWVLKDGLGRIGKLTVATQFGRKFDSDVKRFRFVSSVIYDLSAGVEILTPLFPQYFLVLATLANVGKSIGVTTANVVRAPIQMSFSLQNNLADIAARTSAQQVLADNLGLALAVAATTMVRGNPFWRSVIPFIMYPILSFTDLYCIHKELMCVQLKTVNKERGEIIAEHWLKHGESPTFAEVASQENLFLPPPLEEGTLPLFIRPLSETISSVDKLKEVLVSTRQMVPASSGKGASTGVYGRYILIYKDHGVKGGPIISPVRRMHQVLQPKRAELGKRKSKWRGHAVVVLHDDYTTEDILTALLQVAHLRRLPFRKDLTVEQARTWGMVESLTRAKKDLPMFVSDLKRQGWQINKLLLSSAEKVTFHVDGGLGALAKHLNIAEDDPSRVGGRRRKDATLGSRGSTA
mmetsp:Transcript_14306/g.24221  ORF Transcript_14306/g.24221 Transcript_14306/m.24221 type:complete len:605 (-) Transcript_14306:83-1897(-)